ncbi:MAG: hypothetical protein HOP11_09370 [Saprospiraceae bacterium]|nr:hypothetical protein [Saprospiraceae bacterium]
MQQKTIVSLCTDFGLDDYRVALMKSELLKHSPQIQLLDITHNVQAFDLVEAAFHVSNTLHNFQAKQIHITWVLNASEDQGILLALYNEQYLILPNNGLLELITFSEPAEIIYRISDDAIEYKERISKAVYNICNGENLGEIYTLLEDPVKKISVQPVYQKERIQARILNLDRYGNLIFNIRREPFVNISQGRKFSFSTQNQQVISNFILDQLEIENGSFYVYFTEAGFLVLALCGANAGKVLDLKKDDTLQIVFE